MQLWGADHTSEISKYTYIFIYYNYVPSFCNTWIGVVIGEFWFLTLYTLDEYNFV